MAQKFRGIFSSRKKKYTTQKSVVNQHGIRSKTSPVERPSNRKCRGTITENVTKCNGIFAECIRLESKK